jgi:hypothetical protein
MKKKLCNNLFFFLHVFSFVIFIYDEENELKLISQLILSYVGLIF